VFNDTFKDLVIYTQESPSANEMRGVFISDERNPDEPYVVMAEQGIIDIDPVKGYAYLTLNNGSIHKRGTKEGSYDEIAFKSNIISIGLYENFFKEGKAKTTKREMSLAELRAEHDHMKAVGSIHQYSMMTEYYQRFFIPLACIIFGIVGPPLGLYSRRSGKSSGVTVALVVFVVYYVLMEGAENIANEGMIPPLLAAIVPNFLIGAAGIYILVRSARETQIDPNAVYASLKRRWKLSAIAREKTRKKRNNRK
jgi:lipopolysaccharide export system permease protein